jgi:proline-specific peptidase
MKTELDSSGHLEKIPVPGGQLAAYSLGEGPAVIFLHGGPGDTHHYMKRMAEPLFRHFQCIFFDQRGTGGSTGFRRDPEEFRLEFLFEDLLAVQEYFNTGPTSLVGHSWGAMYALFSCLRYPGCFKKAALLNMGPLDAEMKRATSEHLTSVLNGNEKEEWRRLRSARNDARDRGQFDKVEGFDKKMMHLRVKAWVFNPMLREQFLNEYFQDPAPDREINKWIWEALNGWFSWDRLKEFRTPSWICVGANDSVPVAQAQRIVEMIPHSRLTVFEKCGHITWLEHPTEFYSQLEKFLKSAEILRDGE